MTLKQLLEPKAVELVVLGHDTKTGGWSIGGGESSDEP